MPIVKHVPWTARMIGFETRDRQAEWIDAARRELPRAGAEHPAPLRQIEPAGEVIAVREQHAGAQLRVALELAVREAELVPQREIERVALGDAIEAHDVDVTALLARDGSGRHDVGD